MDEPQVNDVLEDDEPPDAAYVIFSAGVHQASAESLLDAMRRCADEGVPEVHLLLSTWGGSVTAGINLYNVLRAMPFRLVTHSAGDVASIGVAIYVAGEERIAAPNTTFLLHGGDAHASPEPALEREVPQRAACRDSG